jgi:hypothetical protein
MTQWLHHDTFGRKISRKKIVKLLGERLKGTLNHEPPKAVNAQLHLVVAFILMLLVADIRPDHPFTKPDRRNKIPSSPENLASEILYSTPKAPRYRNCALPLDVSHHIRYRIFRGKEVAS